MKSKTENDRIEQKPALTSKNQILQKITQHITEANRLMQQYNKLSGSETAINTRGGAGVQMANRMTK